MSGIGRKRGNRVREIRETRGISQEALSRAVGCSFNTVRNIEKGRTNARSDIALRIAQALSTTVEQLFPLEDAA